MTPKTRPARQARWMYHRWRAESDHHHHDHENDDCDIQDDDHKEDDDDIQASQVNVPQVASRI